MKREANYRLICTTSYSLGHLSPVLYLSDTSLVQGEGEAPIHPGLVMNQVTQPKAPLNQAGRTHKPPPIPQLQNPHHPSIQSLDTSDTVHTPSLQAIPNEDTRRGTRAKLHP